MIKIAIVDDESLVRVGFQTIIDWNEKGYEIFGVFRNGKEAWEAFSKDGFPDVLLTDIRMPEMDGLELVQRIRQKDKEMIILVLSSYEEFEYTRRSIQLGVQDYIPKHLFEPEELIATLTRLTESKRNVAKEHVLRTQADMLDEERQRLMTQTRMLPGIVGPTVDIYPSDYPILSGILEQSPSVCWLAIRIWSTENSDSNDSDRTALGFLLQDLMNKTVHALPLGFDQGLFHGLLFSREKGIEENIMMAGLVKEWMDTVRNNLAILVSAGISEVRLFPNCKAMREQAECMTDRSFYKGAGLYRYETKDNKDLEQMEVQYQHWQRKFISLLKSDSQLEYIQWLDTVGIELSEQNSPEYAFRLVQWMLKIYQNDQKDMSLLEDTEKFKLIPVPLYSESYFKTWEDLKSAFLRNIDCFGVSSKVKLKKHPWLEPVFAYVEKQYAESIRLEEAAGLVNLNIHYFSHRFSQEMEMTFLEYVTQVRIRKSMDLMKQYQLSAEEVASRVGYPNSNYFVKVFKKVTGMTVSEFKSSLTN